MILFYIVHVYVCTNRSLFTQRICNIHIISEKQKKARHQANHKSSADNYCDYEKQIAAVTYGSPLPDDDDRDQYQQLVFRYKALAYGSSSKDRPLPHIPSVHQPPPVPPRANKTSFGLSALSAADLETADDYHEYDYTDDADFDVDNYMTPEFCDCEDASISEISAKLKQVHMGAGLLHPPVPPKTIAVKGETCVMSDEYENTLIRQKPAIAQKPSVAVIQSKLSTDQFAEFLLRGGSTNSTISSDINKLAPQSASKQWREEEKLPTVEASSAAASNDSVIYLLLTVIIS